MSGKGQDEEPEATTLIREAATRFGLGAIVSCERVPEGFSHVVYRLQTTDGVFALKVLDTQLSVGGAVGTVAAAIEVELLAIAGGVQAPEPVADGNGRYIVQLGADRWVRVHHWISGRTRASSCASGDEISCIAQSLADLHTLEIATGPDLDTEVPTRWDARLVAAEKSGAVWSAQLREAVGLFDESSSWASTRPAATLSSHRDVYPRNVLFTGRFANLVDWDVAGPTTPGEEVAVAAVEWSGGIVAVADSASITSFVEQYCAISGVRFE
ncbi:MAG: phosphotransferase, partial [Acidimicrobiales bacterium]